ncbi:hypothetical protein VTJ04DRAFT_1855 [Mycothermus thermophilus]|uniref:uncharacterized protein n=1 Tax=Humicola insolens TaxID=85995 RepID=UPI003744028D
MSLFSAQLHPGRALGFLVLGASLHDVLTRLKAEPQRFPKINLTYLPEDPVRTQIHIALPVNGLRLRFDGPEQRLRLIEVTDFTKIHIFLKPANDKERDLVRPQAASDGTAGPTFRHIYQRFLGPTYDGEYLAADKTYLLSYPGVAFSFPMKPEEYVPGKDVVSLLSATSVPSSMAVFSGDSWAAARGTLWTEVLPSVRLFPPMAKGKDSSPDEVSLIRIHGGGKLQLVRRWSNTSFWLTLGETTPQQLIAELGPPDAIYRKNDQRMYIHKLRATSNSAATRPDLRRPDDLTDTDQSSSHPASDADDSNDEVIEEDAAGNMTRECFYNYFYLGFDVLVSPPTEPSRPPPAPAGTTPPDSPPVRGTSPDREVATKLIIHGNVPGSYPFNRYRRCRWEISYLPGGATSETPFPEVETQLRAAWAPAYSSPAEAQRSQRGMVLNRGWGDSPGSSCELLGGWEGDTGSAGNVRGRGEDTTTTLYGFPGLVFEVLKTGWVSAVTVF